MDTVSQIGEWMFFDENGLDEFSVKIQLRGRTFGFWAPGMIEKSYSGMIGFDVVSFGSGE